jgi:short-subunit dehydrogenase
MDMDVQRIPAILWMDANRVVAVSLKALERDQAVVIPGSIYKLAVFFARLGFA